MKSVSFFAPGKLFIAGEYTVLRGGLALLLPIQWGINVTIKPSKLWRITNPSFQNGMQTYPSITAFPPSVIQSTLKLFARYLSSLNLPLKPGAIRIDSDLGTQAEKYGLGSSGAIIIALLGALATFHELSLSPIELYQLGVMVAYDPHRVQSFADLAISAFQMPLQYRAPTFNHPFDPSLHHLFQQDWQGLLIQPWAFTLPNPWVVFTNQPADSKTIVPTILAGTPQQVWKNKVNQANDLINHFIKQPTVDMIEDFNQLLLSLDQNEKLYTPAMKTLKQLTQQHHAFAKPSGAGGGDCMLVWPSQTTNQRLLKKLLKKQFKILTVF
jgi:phosphomevalonate kinase